MERVSTLIHKLQEQLATNQNAQHLLVTAQMLVAELQQQNNTTTLGKVSITMPTNIGFAQTTHVNIENVIAEEPVTFSSIITEEKPLEIVEKTIDEPVVELPKVEELVEKPIVEPVETATINNISIPNNTSWLFDPIATVPTLAQHVELEPEAKEITIAKKEVFELKDTLNQEVEKEDFNNKLKENKTEVAAILQGTPVKDLRKAIGINDRYLFINELFRGDETMYERSIKTINSFNIYPEAEYWIQRELKVKLGWLEEVEAVKIFDQLVKRRFS
ncbi:MAG: hypothetical protein KBD28_03320 [Chitinophagaceae bacterium]|nr:hypothetical protein [Chitinophagaceae bacterium]